MDFDPTTELPGSSTDRLPASKIRALLRIAPLALALATVSGVATAAITRPDEALVEHVRFEGLKRATAPSLRHLTDLPNGTTMFGVDLEGVRAGIERHPWVKTATVTREWPDTVVVTVNEYKPVALLRTDKLQYLDAEGDAFLEAQSNDLDYPILSGVTADLGPAHPDLPALVIREALSLLSDLDAWDLVPRREISEVAFSRSRGFVVHTTGGAEMLFALERRNQQLDRLAVLLGRGVRTDIPMLIDLAPERIAIVRPLTKGSS